MSEKSKPEPFRHTAHELGVLNRAHAAMMEHLKAGHRYDVAKRAWVDANGEAVAAQAPVTDELGEKPQ